MYFHFSCGFGGRLLIVGLAACSGEEVILPASGSDFSQ